MKKNRRENIFLVIQSLCVCVCVIARGNPRNPIQRNNNNNAFDIYHFIFSLLVIEYRQNGGGDLITIKYSLAACKTRRDRNEAKKLLFNFWLQLFFFCFLFHFQNCLKIILRSLKLSIPTWLLSYHSRLNHRNNMNCIIV